MKHAYVWPIANVIFNDKIKSFLLIGDTARIFTFIMSFKYYTKGVCIARQISLKNTDWKEMSKIYFQTIVIYV